MIIILHTIITISITNIYNNNTTTVTTNITNTTTCTANNNKTIIINNFYALELIPICTISPLAHLLALSIYHLYPLTHVFSTHNYFLAAHDTSNIFFIISVGFYQCWRTCVGKGTLSVANLKNCTVSLSG